MGSHRADRRGPRRRPSETPVAPYAGRRVATQSVPVVAPAVAPADAPAVAVAPTVEVAPAVRLTPAPGSPTAAGKRRAVKHAGSRGSLFKTLPSAPVLVGVATLAVAIGGAVTSANPDLAASGGSTVRQASALSGASGIGSVNPDRSVNVSRDSRRDALADGTDSDLVAAAEQQARQRNAALAQFAKLAQAQADKIALNIWVMPLDSISLTARFGEYGLWASYHTGLDFNGNTGDPIYSVANGVVTSVGYDGAYGNKTVVTLEDGTEIWYCHQTTMAVSEGEVVRAGETIGTVGTTGNVTGSHLHLEVRPGGGDPVDPYQAFLVHGATF
ncbi:MAG: M23 family metallopeptidase [Nocardioides sp.]|nr:M23 family metallopeptidase [Nocardioides sp.]